MTEDNKLIKTDADNFNPAQKPRVLQRYTLPLHTADNIDDALSNQHFLTRIRIEFANGVIYMTTPDFMIYAVIMKADPNTELCTGGFTVPAIEFLQALGFELTP